MSEVADILTATAEQIKAAIPSLNVYDHVIGTIQSPALMVFPPNRLPYGESFNGDGTMWYSVRLFVERRQSGEDQDALNTYISRTGPSSVIEALEGEPTLGGKVADVRVVEAAEYGNWPVGSKTYLGVELRLQAMLL